MSPQPAKATPAFVEDVDEAQGTTLPETRVSANANVGVKRSSREDLESETASGGKYGSITARVGSESSYSSQANTVTNGAEDHAEDLNPERQVVLIDSPKKRHEKVKTEKRTEKLRRRLSSRVPENQVNSRSRISSSPESPSNPSSPESPEHDPTTCVRCLRDREEHHRMAKSTRRKSRDLREGPPPPPAAPGDPRSVMPPPGGPSRTRSQREIPVSRRFSSSDYAPVLIPLPYHPPPPPSAFPIAQFQQHPYMMQPQTIQYIPQVQNPPPPIYRPTHQPPPPPMPRRATGPTIIQQPLQSHVTYTPHPPHIPVIYSANPIPDQRRPVPHYSGQPFEQYYHQQQREAEARKLMPPPSRPVAQRVVTTAGTAVYHHPPVSRRASDLEPIAPNTLRPRSRTSVARSTHPNRYSTGYYFSQSPAYDGIEDLDAKLEYAQDYLEDTNVNPRFPVTTETVKRPRAPSRTGSHKSRSSHKSGSSNSHGTNAITVMTNDLRISINDPADGVSLKTIEGGQLQLTVGESSKPLTLREPIPSEGRTSRTGERRERRVSSVDEATAHDFYSRHSSRSRRSDHSRTRGDMI